MDFLNYRDRLDAVVPGVSEAYDALRGDNNIGIVTSLGAFYNHTIFGRDIGMAAKFVSDFDHKTVWNTILTLASLQGVQNDPKTQEQIGRIHHEMRDYATWQARPFERFGMSIAGGLWGMKNQQILTYFAADTTANYIRLINKYVRHIDESILERHVPTREASSIPLSLSLERAAEWIVNSVDDKGFFVSHRSHRWTLPYQSFQDSVTAYARRDRHPMDTSKPHGFLEVQAFAIDALEDAANLLPGNPLARRWRETAKAMRETLLTQFWNASDSYFSSLMVYDKNTYRFANVPNISAGWTLNTSLWQHIDQSAAREKITAIVKRLFSDEFLTPVGLRTRSKAFREPLGNDIDYHGSQTVWPMFNFMVIEGLRRHGLYRLAAQLEHRIINGVNAIGRFPEFMIVDHAEQLYTPMKHARIKRGAQMVPEINIAFTVVPMMVLAHRKMLNESPATPGIWQESLENSIMSSIDDQTLVAPSVVHDKLQPTPLRLRRAMVGFRSARYILPIVMRKPR